MSVLLFIFYQSLIKNILSLILSWFIFNLSLPSQGEINYKVLVQIEKKQMFRFQI